MASFCSAVADDLNRIMTTCLNLGSTDGVTRRADLGDGALRPRLLGAAGGLNSRSSSGRFLFLVGVVLIAGRRSNTK
jgi:hypothetical protein